MIVKGLKKGDKFEDGGRLFVVEKVLPSGNYISREIAEEEPDAPEEIPEEPAEEPEKPVEEPAKVPEAPAKKKITSKTKEA